MLKRFVVLVVSALLLVSLKPAVADSTSVWDVVCYEAHCYSIRGGTSLVQYDLNAEEVDSLEVSNCTTALELQDNRLYCAFGRGFTEVEILPDGMSFVRTVTFGDEYFCGDLSAILDLKVHGDYGYAANYENGWILFQLSTGEVLAQNDSYVTRLAMAFGFQNYLVLLDPLSGAVASASACDASAEDVASPQSHMSTTWMNLSDPSNPVSAGLLDVSDATDVSVCPNLMAISTEYSGVKLYNYDMFDPPASSELPSISTDYGMHRVVITGPGCTLLFVTGYTGTFYYNVSDPENPVLVDSVTADGNALFFSNERLFIATQEGLLVYLVTEDALEEIEEVVIHQIYIPLVRR